ncbi:hypothetical protein [Paenibacillus albus]|uniref:DUF4829 domain-containing protein n=1 Tax=Paenibacillus albus TaxID=2495582 RepID=A0A3Q8X721_9BACL|nr:hypothetical protein [Paenibacillus albus]AZN41176.1 hypothetical protein EJC50_16985 [Paenibacillus albus]
MNKRIVVFMLTLALMLTLMPVSLVQAASKADLQKNVALIISAFAKQSGYTAADVNSIIGYKPIYQINENNGWLLPKFTNAKVQFNYSTDKNRVKLVQKQKKEYAGGSYDTNATAVLVKTKYGWKIDDYGYNF